MLLKAGTKLHCPETDKSLAILVAQSLSIELGKTHQAVKTAMRWTGASERTVKHWLAGTHAPSGQHLLNLLRHSDTLLKQMLVSSGRAELVIAFDLAAVRTQLVSALAACDEALGRE